MSDLFRDIKLNEEQLAELEKAQSRQQKPAQIKPDISQQEKPDFVAGKPIYEYILSLCDEIEISDYIAEMGERARELGCKGNFEKRVQPYRKRALQNIAEREREVKALEIAELTADFPEWWDGQTIDEDIFCDEFLKGKDLRCINGIVYSVDGMIEDAQLSKEIYERIKYFCKKDIAGRAKKILECLKVKCYSPPLTPDTDRIHVKNGTIILGEDGSRTFTKRREFCTARLNVSISDAERFVRPNAWLDFLAELLEPEDVRTLQEYMGYCLIPSTRAQKMLLIVGKGGEGKSRIGVVMKMLFGEALVAGEIKDLDNGSKARFAREKLVSRLVFLDDDTDLAALGGTSFLKQLITAEIPLEVEPKGRPSFQTKLYSRVLAFGNGAISSLYDTSDGFYRRQIILKAKPRPADREDDTALSDKFTAELPDIFLWALRGLCRLRKNGYRFTISEQARQNLEESRRESCNIISFMDSSGYFEREPKGSISSKDLYSLYVDWCEDNGETFRKPKQFTRFLRDNEARFKLEYDENVTDWSGKRMRGFRGIKPR